MLANAVGATEREQQTTHRTKDIQKFGRSKYLLAEDGESEESDVQSQGRL